MDLKHLSDNLLLAKTEGLVRDERGLLSKILYHLYEIDRRRLFSKRKHASLLEYAMVELKYPEDQACRRISAMRLLKDLSSKDAAKVESKINSGELNLTNIGLAQTLFNHERKAGRPMGNEEKVEVLKEFENKSTREALKVAQKISPEFRPKKRFDFDLIDDEGLRVKLLRVKGKYAHTNPDMSLSELMHLMCDHELEVITPAASRVNSKAEVRRQIWARDGGKCTNCQSTYAVQEEHIVPKAVGGEYSLENIKLLCRKCNQRSAIEFYGRRKMDPHLNKAASS